ncbi:MAG: HAMP domain-containing histidine kinase [Lachnospiraceae bacterium]|nr:HAMP domain-containing histidine kinase [Lachnospiraceae bacterium]
MTLLVIVLAIVSAALFTANRIYRRQVQQLCRQLKFINENETQQRPTVDINTREFKELADEIAALTDRVREIEVKHMRQDEALRETIANISHDIRTPLTSLDGYFQLLTSEELPQEKKAQYAEIIRSRITSLNDMLDELFTYAKLQDPNYELELSPMDMTAATADIVLSFYDEIRRSGNEPKIELPEEPVMISAEKSSFTRIVQNLVRNALIHGKNLSVRLTVDAGQAVLECSDELVNKDEPVDASRVFERFYKADKARGTKGSGLGLAISKELTEKMGGKIEAECEDGVFTIRLRFDVLRT